MITRTIQTPFHTATLLYHEGREESDYEIELVRRYEQFLNEIQRRSDEVQAATERCYHEQLVEDEINSAVQELEERLKPVIKAIHDFKASKHIAVNGFFLIRDEYERITESYFELQEGKLTLMNELITQNNEDFKNLYDWFEDESDGLFGRIEEYSEALCKDDVDNALDWVSFVDDLDEMKGDWQKVCKAWDKAHKLRDETVKKSNACMAKLNAFTEKAGQLQDDMDGLDEQWKALNN